MFYLAKGLEMSDNWPPILAWAPRPHFFQNAAHTLLCDVPLKDWSGNIFSQLWTNSRTSEYTFQMLCSRLLTCPRHDAVFILPRLDFFQMEGFSWINSVVICGRLFILKLSLNSKVEWWMWSKESYLNMIAANKGDWSCREKKYRNNFPDEKAQQQHPSRLNLSIVCYFTGRVFIVIPFHLWR